MARSDVGAGDPPMPSAGFGSAVSFGEIVELVAGRIAIAIHRCRVDPDGGGG